MKRKLTVSGNVSAFVGYSNLTYEIVSGLQEMAFDLTFNGDFDSTLVPRWFNFLKGTYLGYPQQLVICPPNELDKYTIDKVTTVLTMWESDWLNEEWVEEINKACRVITPSAWGKQMMERNGVEVPIHVIPLGHDPQMFPFDCRMRLPVTFGTAGNKSQGGCRKNLSEVLEVFQRAFPYQDDVRLKIKSTEPMWNADERVDVFVGYMAPQQLYDWYSSLTCYVNMSAGEGFGLHLLESMAVGRPLITAPHTAISTYATSDNSYLVPYYMCDAKGSYRGSWTWTDQDAVIDAMRAVYADPFPAREMGWRASRTAKQFTWQRTVREIVQVLNR